MHLRRLRTGMLGFRYQYIQQGFSQAVIECELVLKSFQLQAVRQCILTVCYIHLSHLSFCKGLTSTQWVFSLEIIADESCVLLGSLLCFFFYS